MKTLYKINALIFVVLLIQSFVFVKTNKIIREPYVQAVWADSASVFWKSPLSAKKIKLFYGTRQKNLQQEADVSFIEHHQTKLLEAVANNLKADTKYFYKIEIDDEVVLSGKDYYFVSSPKKNRSFSFYAMGDIGAKKGQTSYAAAAAREIDDLSRRPDFGLGLGDIVYPKGQSSMYDEYLFAPLAPILRNIPFYPVLGNHDWMSDPEGNFTKEWKLPNNEHYFGFEYCNTYFIGLDSRDGNFYNLDNQTEWLKKRLQDVKGKYDWVVVYLHHNGKTCSYKHDYKHVIGLYDVFAQGGVDLVLNGHAHTYERLKPYDKNGNVIETKSLNHFNELSDGFISITTGAGGKLNHGWEPNTSNVENCKDGSIVAKYEHVPHFSVFEIKGKQLKMKAINSLTGKVFDDFTMCK